MLKTRIGKCLTSSPNKLINTVNKASHMTNKTFHGMCAVKTRKVSEHANVCNAKKKFKTKPWEWIQQ